MTADRARGPWRRCGGTVLSALIAGLVVRRVVVFVTLVDSWSMAPALLPGRRVLTRRPATSRPVHRGDVVVVRSDELATIVVKRVVGLPGERVTVHPDGSVTVDGRALPEPYVVHRGGPSGTFEVTAGHLLLLGDNRAASHDARSWSTPGLPVSAVLGRVVRSHRW